MEQYRVAVVGAMGAVGTERPLRAPSSSTTPAS